MHRVGFFSADIFDGKIDGADSDFGVRTPHYEQNGADYELTYSSKIPFQIEVHQGKSPQQSGYKAFLWVQLPDGRVFTRNRTNLNVDSGWYEYKQDENGVWT